MNAFQGLQLIAKHVNKAFSSTHEIHYGISLLLLFKELLNIDI